MYRILIADDEEMVRDLLAKNIGRLALDVEVAAVASDGREAFELATRLKPDIVITDIAMPFLNGLELIRKMRENGIESKNIIISGYDEFDYARQAIALGVQNYLLKPFLPRDIKNELEKMIRELDSQKALAQNMEMLATIAESRSALMRETVLKDILEGSQEKTELWKESEIPQDASWYTAGILKTDQNSWDFSSQKKVEEFLEMIRDRYFSTELSMYAVSFDRKSIALLWCAKKGELATAQRQIVEGLQHVQRSLKKYYQIRLTVALGSPYPVIEQTADSYREAKSVWRGMVDAQEGIRVYSKETEKLKQPDFENETKNQIRFWKSQIRLCVRTGQKQEALVNLAGLIKSYAALADKKNDYICASVAELIYGVDELPQCSIVPTGNHIEMGSGNSILRGSDERYLLFKHDCYGGEHDHYDRLDISYEAFGKRIAPDLGTTGYGALMHYDYYKNTGSHNTVNIDGKNQAPANGVLTKCEEMDGIVCLEAVADWTAPYQMPDSFTIVQWDEAAYRTVSMKRTILWAPEWFAEVFFVNGIPQGKTADWVMHFSGDMVSSPLGDAVSVFSEEKPYKHLHSMTKFATQAKKEGEGKTAQLQGVGEPIQTIYQDGDVVTWVYGMENGQAVFVGKGPDNPSISDINYRIERADGPTAVFAHVIASAKGSCPIKNVTFEQDENSVTIHVVQADEKVVERKIEK